MAVPRHRDKIAPIDIVIEKNVFLEETLGPLCKLTCMGGILLDWCRPSVQSRAPFIIRCLSISLVFFFLLLLTTFELVQLIIVLSNMKTVKDVIPNLIWFITLPLSLTTMACYNWNHKKYQSFFEDFFRMEKEVLSTRRIYICKSKNVHVGIYLCYIVMTTMSLLTIGYVIFDYPEAPYLLSYYPVIRETLSLPVVAAIHLTSVILKWILFSMIDFVPAFVFYHQGLALCRLNKDFQAFFEDEPDQTEFNEGRILGLKNLPTDKMQYEFTLRQIWNRYENIAAMVEKANHRFGRLILFGHGVMIVEICALLYSLLGSLTDFEQNHSQVMTYLINLIAYTIRLVSCALLMAKIYTVSGAFRENLSRQLSYFWDRIPIEDRNVLVVFSSRLQSRCLAASPLGLYDISPSILLSILGLVASYVVILLQS